MPNVSLRDSAIKAKVSFVGSTGAILASQSYNVGSVSRSGTGVYTINFSQILDSANYSVTGSVSKYTTQPQGSGTLTVSSQSTSNFTVAAAAGVENFDNRQAYDPAIVCVMVIAADDTTSPPTYALRSQAIHARASFNGASASPAINSSSVNVSSVSRPSTGNYTVTYVNALSAVDHFVGVNSSISTLAVSPGSMETDALFPTTTQAKFYAKIAGENIGTETFFDPSLIEFVASGTDTTAAAVSLKTQTCKTWACMSSGTLVANLGISSTTLIDTGQRRFNFTDGYIDHTIIGSCSQSTIADPSTTANVTFTEKGPTSVVANTYAFGENRNSRVALNPTRINIAVFGVINEFEVSLSATEVTDSCIYVGAQTACTNNVNVTATPLGGTAPYTYQWNIIEIVNNIGDFSIINPTSATATLRCQDNNGSYTAYFACTVTDSTGKQGRSNAVKFISTHIDDTGTQ